MDWYEKKIIRSCDVNFFKDEMSGEDVAQVDMNNDVRQEEVASKVDPIKEVEHDSEIFEDAISEISTSPVKTSSGRIVKRPAWMEDYVGNVEIESEPSSYMDAMKSSDSNMWRQSMDEEFNNLQENGTWEVIDKPIDKNILGCKWVFKIKRGPDGNVNRYKSRLVAKGYTQTYGNDYWETYAPVADYTTLRCKLAIAANMDLSITHLDFECAYLNGKLSEAEEIFMEIPPGLNERFESYGKVLKLKKCLYGLKQSDRNWNAELNSVLIQCNLKQCDVDKCLYLNRDCNKIKLLVLNVDDITIASNDCEFVLNLKKS